MPQGQNFAEGRKVQWLYQMCAHVKPNILHQDTKFYQKPGESDDEDEPVWNTVIPTGSTEVPTPSADPLTPSTATLEPEPELRRSSRMADRGTRPDYQQLHNQLTWDRVMFTCEKVIRPKKAKQSMVAITTTKQGHITPRHAAKEMLWMRRFLDQPILEHAEPTPMRYDKISARTHDAYMQITNPSAGKWLQTKHRLHTSHRRIISRIL